MRISAVAAVGVTLLSTLLFAAGNAAAAPDKPVSTSTVAIRDCIDVPNQDVGRGSTGNYVREVQCLLNWAVNPGTYHIIAEDGQFGPDTEGKVRTFQQCANTHGAGLAVDGRVGRNTAPQLEAWAASSAYVC